MEEVEEPDHPLRKKSFLFLTGSFCATVSSYESVYFLVDNSHIIEK